MSGNVLFVCGIHTSQLHASYMVCLSLHADYQRLITRARSHSYISVTCQLHGFFMPNKEYNCASMLHLGLLLLLILPPMCLL